jgi:flagellar protein FlgJ
MSTSVIAVSATSDASVQTDPAARHAKLTHAAQQFEAVMLGELMKPLAKSSGVIDGDGEQSGNAMQGYGVEAMAGALARSGALGFAHRIVAAVERQSARNSSEINSNGSKVPAAQADKPTGGR